MRPLDARSRRVAQLKFLCRLLPPSLLQRLVMLTRLQPDDPRLLLRLRTLSAERTWCAILPGETRLEDHPVLRIGVRQPGDALLARRAGHHLPLPVHHEATLAKAHAGAGLPARVLGDRTDNGHPEVALTGDEDMGVGVALIDQVLAR